MKLGYFKMEQAGAEPGGGAAPAPAPASEAASPAGDPPSVNWVEMADDSLPPEVTQEEVPEGETPPEPAKPADPPKPEGELNEDGTPKVVEPPVEPPPPVDVAKQQEEAVKAAKQARDHLHAELSTLYAGGISEEDKTALLTDPASVMPKMLAQSAMDGAALAVREIRALLPQLLEQHVTQRDSVKSAWSDFDKANPDLAKPEYRKAVISAINTVKAAGQKLSKEQSIAAVARTTRAILGLADAGTPAPVKTQASGAPVAPFVPVGRGNAAPRAPAKPKNENPWAQFAEDD